MGLIHLVIVILAVGVLVWVIDRAPFIAAEFKGIAKWVIIAITALWLVSIFIGDVSLPRLR
jgi:hypothetical protein